jgi:hypothetical protein
MHMSKHEDTHSRVDEPRYDCPIRPLCKCWVAKLGLDGESDMLEPIKELVLLSAASGLTLELVGMDVTRAMLACQY